MSIYYNAGHTDDPITYNANAVRFKFGSIDNGYSGGCVGQLACTSCGTINSGTCLCAGIFTCCECNFENGQDKIKLMDEMRREIKVNGRNSFYIISKPELVHYFLSY